MTFSYPGCEIPALRNFSLTAAPGERIALVGPKGCGKSTVARLLSAERLVASPNTGLITLDRIGVNHIDPDALRGFVGVASQDAMLFTGTIAENLKLARPDASDAQMVEAAKLACAHDWIARMPKGYATPISERGLSLSGGERQTLALARLFLADPAVVVLDEPTSALDPETSAELMRRLSGWLEGRTCFIITHRLELLSLAGRVIIMKDGRVVADAPPGAVLSAVRTGTPIAVKSGIPRPGSAEASPAVIP